MRLALLAAAGLLVASLWSARSVMPSRRCVVKSVDRSGVEVLGRRNSPSEPTREVERSVELAYSASAASRTCGRSVEIGAGSHSGTLPPSAPQPAAVSVRASGAALLAAATLAFNVVPAMDPTAALMLQPVHAEEDVSDEGLSPFQKRQRELERRREQLRAA